MIAVSAICAPSAPAEPVVGVNAVNPLRASIADQNTLLAQLHAAGVHVIRCGITADAKGIDFAKRASAQGIQIELLVSPGYPSSAPSRAYQPAAFPSMWGGHPLSSADPTLSKAAFQKLFDLLDENNIPVAAFELGNEINWAAFNPEFPLPGEGKVFSFAELSTDPEAKQIAKGYIQYLKILAVLKEVRDHSRVNHSAPILLAGLVSAPDGDKPWNTKKEDKVGLPATIKFMQAHGLDELVDGYGIHSYPSNDHPGDPAAPTVELEECVSNWPGHPDHILLATGACESQHYTRLRNAGYAYKSAQPGAQPLYRCYSEAEKSHFAANTEACNNQGKSEALLGYDLKD